MKLEKRGNPEQEKALLAGITKQFGQGSIFLATDKGLDVPRFSTGILSLDVALGGGIGQGRIIEILGQESSGKSTCCLQIAATIHKLGGRIAFIDAENALDLSYAKALGVKTEELWISQPDFGEAAIVPGSAPV